MLWRISAAKVSRISSGSCVHSFMIWRGGATDITVTAEAPAGTPRSWASGSHGLSSSSSAAQKANLPGCPRVERSNRPGVQSSRLISTSRTVRPMVALARLPLASTLCVAFMPIAPRTGPFTTMNGALPPVLAVLPCTLKRSSHMACTTATTTGM